MPASAVKRSACDQCRAKRIRCLRAPDSIASCARCCHTGVRCVTSAAGQSGRPPKQRIPNLSSTTTTSPANLYSLGTASQQPHPLGDTLTHTSQPDIGTATGDISAYFGTPPMHHDPMNGQSHLQGLFGTDDDFNAMMQMGEDSSTALDIDVDLLYNYGESVLPLLPSPQRCDAVSSLAKFRDGIEQRLTTINTFYAADPSKVLQRCETDCTGEDVENPAALLLTCTKDFIDIIQSFTPSDQFNTQTAEALSTETVLLILSSYLAFMRLFDSMFYHIHQWLCKVPPEVYKFMKVQSVLRIGGVSSLQDMPLKIYAMAILSAIDSEVQTLERQLGIPGEYCLSGEAAATFTTTAHGVFARADRQRLFAAVIAQEDVKSRRGTKSYAESARTSIEDSKAFLDD